MMSAFRVLAKLRRLRGTALDVFGKTAERRIERALIGDYESLVAELARRARAAQSRARRRARADSRAHPRLRPREGAPLVAAKKKEAELLAAFRAAKPVGPKTWRWPPTDSPAGRRGLYVALSPFSRCGISQSEGTPSDWLIPHLDKRAESAA